MSSKLRDVVESLLERLDYFGINEGKIVLLSYANKIYGKLIQTDRTLDVLQKAKATLSEPLRNCDVGTVEQQKARFKKFCNSHINCNSCPLVECDDDVGCAFAFMQMSYENKGTNEHK
jgi:hypothetical protein